MDLHHQNFPDVQPGGHTMFGFKAIPLTGSAAEHSVGAFAGMMRWATVILALCVGSPNSIEAGDGWRKTGTPKALKPTPVTTTAPESTASASKGDVSAPRVPSPEQRMPAVTSRSQTDRDRVSTSSKQPSARRSTSASWHTTGSETTSRTSARTEVQAVSSRPAASTIRRTSGQVASPDPARPDRLQDGPADETPERLIQGSPFQRRQTLPADAAPVPGDANAAMGEAGLQLPAADPEIAPGEDVEDSPVADEASSPVPHGELTVDKDCVVNIPFSNSDTVVTGKDLELCI